MKKKTKKKITRFLRKKTIRNTIYFIIGLFYALISILRGFNWLGVLLYSKLPKVAKISVIYALIGLSVLQSVTIYKNVFIQEVQIEIIEEVKAEVKEEVKEEIIEERIATIEEETKILKEIKESQKRVPKTNKEAICLNLKEQGYNDNAVAGVMLNIQKESNFRSDAVNSIGCSGMVQWCFARKENLKNTYGNNWTNIDNQLELLNKELDTKYSKVKNFLSSNHSFAENTEYFCNNFEVPGQSICSSRKQASYGSELLDFVKNDCYDVK